MELWNETIIDRSWQLLQQLRKTIDFVLIGGWAVYLFTKSMKSKDVDIVVDFNTLSQLKNFGIRKNDKLKKYEIEVDGTDIDIYVPYYSQLVLPAETIIKETVSVEGFKLPKPEILLILKQQAAIERENSVKGQKDRIDIISLLMKSDIDFENYKLLLKKPNLANYLAHLRKTVRTASMEFEYLGITNLREIKKIKQKLLSTINDQK